MSSALRRPLVLAHGCFDPMHFGHVKHLQAATRFGKGLVVSVTSDRFVRKGANRPTFTAEQRAEVVRHLAFVDEVAINDNPDAVPMIERYRPDVYVKGADYAGFEDEPVLAREIEAVKAHGGEFRVLDGTVAFSSSRTLTGERFDLETLRYLEGVRTMLPRIEKAFEAARRLRVLFVGERIVDEYVHVDPLSKPSKETLVAVEVVSTERFEGGVVAAHAHCATLCEAAWLDQPPGSGPPVTKRRYVERGFNRKLFEVYGPSRLTLTEELRDAYSEALKEMMSREPDVVVALDFGHGLIDETARAQLRSAKYLAANAQSNAGNWGFNPVTKYAGADLVCVDVQEARLAANYQTITPVYGCAQHAPIERVMAALDFSWSKLIVTAGRHGAHWRNGPGKLGKVPALAHHPVDTIGAGDCFLAFAAPLMAAGLDIEAACLVGTVAAGMKTEIVGHRRHIHADVLLQTVRSLLR